MIKTKAHRAFAATVLALVFTGLAAPAFGDPAPPVVDCYATPSDPSCPSVPEECVPYVQAAAADHLVQLSREWSISKRYEYRVQELSYRLDHARRVSYLRHLKIRHQQRVIRHLRAELRRARQH